MELIIKKVRKGNIRKKVKEIYNSSFPKEERIPFWMMFFTSFTNTTDFFAFYDDDTLIGFTYMAEVNNILFIMFLAVDENTRCKGYGSKILNLIKQKYPNDKIIIDSNKEIHNDVEFEWNVISDFEVSQNTDDNKITLFVDDENCIGGSFLLQVIMNQKVFAEITIDVIEAF